MKATELLQKQHRDIEALLQRLRAAGQGDERAIRQELAAVLVAHSAIELESFYPALKDALPEEINEALEEHGLADVELARLLVVEAGDETADAKATVLAELVINHIRREESEILGAAERELTNDVLLELGDRMSQRFRQILDTGYDKLLQKALDDELPRPARRAAAKKPRRRPAATAKRATARKGARTKTRRLPAKRTTPRPSPAKRTSAQRGQAASKPKRTRASAGTARTRA